LRTILEEIAEQDYRIDQFYSTKNEVLKDIKQE
jgi:hypothetical protein